MWDRYKGTPIQFSGGYRYCLKVGHETSMKLSPAQGEIDHPFMRIKNGRMYIRKGYSWDGPSGPTIDTNNFMRGSLYHDALYQLMREGLLHEQYREFADDVLYRMIRENGMFWLRAKWVYWGVRIFGAKHARKK